MMAAPIPKPKVKRKPRKREEAQIQEALIAWSRYINIYKDYPEKIYDYLIAIPNGGVRNIIEAASLKRQGVKAGVSDLLLAYPKSYEEISGLWLEIKSKKGILSTAQKEWICRMEGTGVYETAVAYSLEEAKQAILDYLGIT